LPRRIWNATRHGFRLHGIRFPFVLSRQWITWVFRSRIAPRSFTLAGKNYPYWVHPLNLDNERTVEVPLAREFLQGTKEHVLEIRNILSQNDTLFPHDIVDKYERAAGVINEDVVTFAPTHKYDAIVTLSTLEHVGWDEEPREPEKILRAIDRLKELLADGGELLATLPMGYNRFVDNLVRQKKTGFSETRYLVRVSANNLWREGSCAEALAARYNSPYPNANALLVGFYRKAPAKQPQG
jgi:SAM-dependent methyltransferase